MCLFLMSETQLPDFEDTVHTLRMDAENAKPVRGIAGLSLFWRTFFLLLLLLLGSILAWLQTLRALEFEPRAIQTAQLLGSQVNLSRVALVHADGIARISLLKTMRDEEGLRIVPREPSDTYSAVDTDTLSTEVARELVSRLGPGTVVASKVNAQAGLWISFDIDGDAYWLQTDPGRLSPASGKTWLIWLMVAAALSVTGAALIARRINRPLKELSFEIGRAHV